jgi:Outer membrane protein beta-barrel domain
VSAARRAVPALAAAVALAALLAAPAAAQERVRNGFWADVGFGYGRLRLRCSNCSDVGTAYGGTITVTLGRSLSRKVVLGLEGQVWSSWESGPSQQVRSLTVVAQWYPWLGKHFFVRGGTGVVQGPVVPSVAGTQGESVKGTGVGLTIGVGYDFPIDRHVAIAVQAASHVAALGDLDLGGVTLQDTIGYVTRFAVALVFR